MGISWQALGDTVFLVSRDGDRPLLYAPLQGLVLEANDAYVERFRAALGADEDAARAIGLEPETVADLARVPDEVRRTFDPVWPEVFEPTSVTLFLTHKCTLRCVYCYCEGGAGRDIDWPVLERAVRFALDNAKRLGRDARVAFHGGDVGACWPLFRRAVEFVEAESAAAGVKTSMSIGTNGFYTEEQAAYIAAHIASATVSIDGTPTVHDRSRITPGGGPSLATVLRSLAIFESEGLSYSIRMTVTAESLPALAESMAYLCENTHARTIRAEPLYARGRATVSHLQAPDPEAFVAAYRQARTVAERYGRQLTYSGARISGPAPAFCSFARPTFGVTPDGDLTCCYEILHPDDPLATEFFYGHIEPDGSAIVVDEEQVAAIRAGAKARRQGCAHCFCVYACAGDCAAKTIDSGRGDGESTGRCEITRALVYDMLGRALAGEDPTRPSRDTPRAAPGAVGPHIRVEQS
ncbi:MAG: radical SAM protein [Coriobacteriia bacterium]|nr:radical SAM protein [Coriobacteriia bacterium]